MTFATLFTLSTLLVFFTVLPLWRNESWWVRVLDFPRLQLAISALCLATASAFLLDFSYWPSWVVTASAIACFIYHAWWIFPYTRLAPFEVKQAQEPDRENTVSILTANVLTPNRRADDFVKLVREHQPDIVVTLETDLWWESRLDVLEADYPHTLKCPLDNLYGMHLYSRLALEDAKIQFLVEPDKPSMHVAAVLPSGRRIRMHFLHPAPPSPTENDESSERDAELLIVGKSAAKSALPVVITGDLNDVAWSATTRLFRKISSLLDPRIGRGMFNTFHAGYWFVRFPVDHVFHSKHFTLSKMRRLPAFGSDHFGVLVELVCEKEKPPEQNGLEPQAGDQAWANEKTGQKEVKASDVHTPDA